MIFILFGKPGGGKNFVGDIIDQYFDFYHYDADQDMLSEIEELVAKNQIVPDDLRDKYIDRVLKKSKELCNNYPRLIVTHAFTKNRHRRLFQDNFPEAKFLYVTADKDIRDSRLSERGQHMINKDYAQKVETYFEEPNLDYTEIINNKGKKEIIEQLDKIINDKKRQGSIK